MRQQLSFDSRIFPTVNCKGGVLNPVAGLSISWYIRQEIKDDCVLVIGFFEVEMHPISYIPRRGIIGKIS